MLALSDSIGTCKYFESSLHCTTGVHKFSTLPYCTTGNHSPMLVFDSTCMQVLTSNWKVEQLQRDLAMTFAALHQAFANFLGCGGSTESQRPPRLPGNVSEI